MEIEHILHPEHPLVMKSTAFYEECMQCLSTGIPCNECGYVGYICYACGAIVTNDDLVAYICSACDIVMHQICAEAPNVILSANHNHPLTLISVPSVNSVFTPHLEYICSQCNEDKTFSISGLLNYCRYEIEHKCHDHPLTVQDKGAMEFFCDACGTTSKDRCFVCSKCSFWIHHKCALLPTTTKNSFLHDCTLKLAYNFPQEYTNYRFDKCNVCDERVSRSHWIYYCGDCRYFVHVKCATTTRPLFLSDDEDDQNLVRFPGPDRYANLMSQLIEKMRLRDADSSVGQGEIMHWDHEDHPLTLWDTDGQLSKNDDDDHDQEVIVNFDGILCEACVQPMMAPFYHCSQCSYYLHKSCALLPLELPHIEYPDQQLQIGRKSRDSGFGMFQCICCEFLCNGFLYSSQTKDFEFCIHCANLPTRIAHESHKHPLGTTKIPDLSDQSSPEVDTLSEICDACNNLLFGVVYKYEGESYGSRYDIHFRCAMKLPHTLTHDYDNHPITLRYSPAPNHPSDYYCEICEDDLDPTFWFYYCNHCQYSFHIQCLSPPGYDVYVKPFSKIKFGGIYQVDNHQHPLKLVGHRGNESKCLNPNCSEIICQDYPVLECTLLCGNTFCTDCAINPTFVM